MSQKFTPSHFPRGTVIRSSLYHLGDDGIYRMSFMDDGSAEFTVDYVKLTPFTQEGCLIFTTAVKDPAFDGVDQIVFHSTHVNKIISIGKQMIIKHAPGFELGAFLFRNGCGRWRFSLLLRVLCYRIDPVRSVDSDKMLSAMKKMGVVRVTTQQLDDDRRCYPPDQYFFNKKKVKKWVKQNFNRFIVTEAEKRANEKAHDELIRKYMEEDLNRDFDERYSESDEILNADIPLASPFDDSQISAWSTD